MVNFSSYGLWLLVLINSLILIVFCFILIRPRTTRERASFVALVGFLIALFTEKYGFPLTAYLVSGIAGVFYPGLDLFSQQSGSLWSALLGLQVNPFAQPLHSLSGIVIFTGMLILYYSARMLHEAKKENGGLANTGPYGVVRHPQYAALMFFMFGFVLEWPTVLTLVMFPILVTIYSSLAQREESELLEHFGEKYALYAASTPAFVPRLRSVTSNYE
jgi:protein-S-isoprenylcysteine O-methyltransferase Ste14